jgi:hypothetical protein
MPALSHSEICNFVLQDIRLVGQRSGGRSGTQGKELYKVCNEVVVLGERRDITAHVSVTAPAKFGDEPVA